ncbi:chondroitin sulfate synthase 2-like [Tubulanus polymorphus]|uniref:chondroitin sulfate synthase 2-like n=1 Tax=Tubulanus polymorphus TaxID=672921 RepID=UPI003DA42A8A
MIMLPRRVITFMSNMCPLLFGLIVGVCLSLITSTFSNEASFCQEFDQAIASDSSSDDRLAKLRDTKSIDETDGDFEPKWIENTVLEYNEKRAFKRPLFVSQELNIHPKLFVGVYSSANDINSLAVAMNRTLRHTVSKLIFFMGPRAKNTVIPKEMSIVSFNTNRHHLIPLFALQYINNQNTALLYDWYMFVSDNTYLNGQALKQFVHSLSISDGKTAFIGVPKSDDRNLCDIKAGLIISRNVFEQVISRFSVCERQATASGFVGGRIGDILANCIYQTTQLTCKSTSQYMEYVTTTLDNHSQLDALQQLNVLDLPHSLIPVSIYGIQKETDLYKLHKEFCHHQIHQIHKKIEDNRHEIKQVSYLTPIGKDAYQWPVDIDVPHKPTQRYDVIRWEYFTEKSIYLKSDQETESALIGIDEIDISSILNKTFLTLQDQFGNHLHYTRLVNGYRRFDPSRGIEYMVDVEMYDSQKKCSIIHHANLIRPLNHVELVPIQYVTETTHVTVIIAVSLAVKDQLYHFLTTYLFEFCKTGTNVDLMMVFERPEILQTYRFIIDAYDNCLKWVLLDEVSGPFSVIRGVIAKKAMIDSIMFLGSVTMHMNLQFVNRVRINTIRGQQVFFPIGFWQYDPRFTGNNSTNFDVHKDNGYFNTHSAEHASFYASDFLAADNKSHNGRNEGSSSTIMDMFVQFSDVHILHGIDPDLRLAYKPFNCTGEHMANCHVQHAKMFGDKRHLATYFLKQSGKL